MGDTKHNAISSEALGGSLRDYRAPQGKDLMKRMEPFYNWQTARRDENMWPYARSTASAPKTHCAAVSDTGQRVHGVNFASQDYLSLSSHPEIKETAIEAVKDYGVHSAGSASIVR